MKVVEASQKQTITVEREGDFGKIHTNEKGAKLQTFEAAYRAVLKQLSKNGESILSISLINNNRYSIVKTDKSKYLLTYKREVFKNFGRQFRSLGYKGVGDTINVSHLKEAIQKEVEKIIAVFPNGSAYTINLHEFLVDSIPWRQKEGTEVRSISIHKYKLFANLMEGLE